MMKNNVIQRFDKKHPMDIDGFKNGKQIPVAMLIVLDINIEMISQKYLLDKKMLVLWCEEENGKDAVSN